MKSESHATATPTSLVDFFVPWRADGSLPGSALMVLPDILTRFAGEGILTSVIARVDEMAALHRIIRQQ